MNFKRVFLIFLILVAGVASLSIVSADSSVNYKGADFNIPDGFSENKSFEQDGVDISFNNQIPAKMSAKSYVNGDKMIVLGTFEFNSSDDAKKAFDFSKNFANGTKTISGKDGIYSLDGDGFFGFNYLDGKTIRVVSASDESLVEKVIPK